MKSLRSSSPQSNCVTTSSAPSRRSWVFSKSIGSEGAIDTFLAHEFIVTHDSCHALLRKRLGMQHTHLKLPCFLPKENGRFFYWFCHVPPRFRSRVQRPLLKTRVSYQKPTAKVKRTRRTPKIPNHGKGSIWPVRRVEGKSHAEAQRRGVWDLKANIPLSPIAKQGKIRSGMEVGTPFPVAFQATRWNRRIRIAPTATRGTDARPSTSIATKRSFAHISCEGLRQPSESRERTPVSNTCHSV